ncbi:MAG: acyltransferase family protein [Acetobacteraceae bacterium]
MRRLECLDGLRGLLALYVLVSHMIPFAALPGWVTRPLLHGGAAVDVFFILSGMVIIRSLKSFDYQPKPFLVARVGRIFPVFLVVFPLAVAIQVLPIGFGQMPWIQPEGPAHMTWSEGWPATWMPEIAAHLVLAQGLFPDGILPNAWVSFLGSAWSLSTEWQFYLLIAFVACSHRRTRNRLTGRYEHPGRCVTADTRPNLISRAAAPLTPRAYQSTFRSPGMRSWEWLVWMFLVLSVLAIGTQALSPEGWQFSRAFLPNKAQYFALGMAAAALQATPGRPMMARYGTVLVCTTILCWLQGGAIKVIAPLVWTACLGAQMRPEMPGLRNLSKLLRSRLLLWLGALSYCIYLANEPVQKLLGVELAHMLPGSALLFTIVWLPAAVMAPIGVAWALHRTVEPAGQAWGRSASGRLRLSGA